MTGNVSSGRAGPWSGIVLLAGLLGVSWAASAEEESAPPPKLPRHRIVYGNLLSARYNPLGLEDRLDLEYRYRLVESDALLWNDTYLGVGFVPAVNPVMTRLGATVTIKPIAVATLSVAYSYTIWYGAMGHLRAFSSPDDDYSDSEIDRGSERAITTTGHELQLRAGLVGKIGPVALSNGLEFYFARMDLEGGGDYYYQPRFDALVRNPGWLLSNDTDLVYITDFGFVFGARNSLVHAFEVNGDAAGRYDSPSDRLGPLLAYVFFDKPRGAFNKPTILLIVNWWLKHRFRTGEDVAQGVPYLVLAFKCEGEIWGGRK